MNKSEYIRLKNKISEYEHSSIEEFSQHLPKDTIVKINKVLLKTGHVVFDSKRVEACTYAQKLNSDRSLTLNGLNHVSIYSTDLSSIKIKPRDYIYELLNYCGDRISRIDTNLPFHEYEMKVNFWKRIKNSIIDKCPHDFDNYGNCKLCSIVSN